MERVPDADRDNREGKLVEMVKIVATMLFVAGGLLALFSIAIMGMAVFGDAEVGAVGFTGRINVFAVGFLVAGIGAGCGGLGYWLEKRWGRD